MKLASAVSLARAEAVEAPLEVPSKADRQAMDDGLNADVAQAARETET